MKKATTIGIDLAKNSFSVYGVDGKGKPVLKQTLKRNGVAQFFFQSSPVPCRYGSVCIFGILGQKN